MGVTTRLYKESSEPKWPTVSLIVPVHNEEALLGFTLNALSNQFYATERPEIVVVLNGCTDGSRAIAKQYPLKLIEDARCGMSWAKNLGAQAATGDILIFIDADTTLEPSGVQQIVEAMQSRHTTVAVVAGSPLGGGWLTRLGFRLANWHARRNRLQSVGPVLAVSAQTFVAVGGFDEELQQEGGSDLIRRALDAGAEYVFVDAVHASTSIRRFGLIRQLFAWWRNQRRILRGRRTVLAQTPYRPVR